MAITAIIDYGSGNLRSAANAFDRAAREAGAHTEIAVTDDPRLVRRADRIVLPGVGAFAECRRGLHAVDGMVEALTERVTAAGGQLGRASCRERVCNSVLISGVAVSSKKKRYKT